MYPAQHLACLLWELRHCLWSERMCVRSRNQGGEAICSQDLFVGGKQAAGAHEDEG